jgi:WD40 repeat protein
MASSAGSGGGLRGSRGGLTAGAPATSLSASQLLLMSSSASSSPAGVMSVCFSRNDAGARLLVACKDSTLRILDGKTLEPLRPFPGAAGNGGGGSGGGGESAANHFKRPSPSSGSTAGDIIPGAIDAAGDGGGGLLSSSALSSSAGLLDTNEIVLRHPAFRMPHSGALRALFSPSGHFAVCGGANGLLYSWLVDSGEFDSEIGSMPPFDPRSPGGGSSGVARGSKPSLTSPLPPGPDASLTNGSMGPHEGRAILTIDWTADARFLASGDEAGNVVLWTAAA